ncbi:hypothetical protein LN650_08290 [Klebsiella pneumoniae subsp. pneumoniae]|nr:hypothetical protein [Klebsiella pneumoniae subsp. pneumoniae]
MRVNFEKPRTTVGWKGLINDPHMDGSFDVEGGLKIARRLLVELVNMGTAAGDGSAGSQQPAVPWGSVQLVRYRARTTESQTHREMASGLVDAGPALKTVPMCSPATAINAMRAPRRDAAPFRRHQSGRAGLPAANAEVIRTAM